MSKKGFTVRLDEEQAAELEAVAEVDGVPVADAAPVRPEGHQRAKMHGSVL